MFFVGAFSNIIPFIIVGLFSVGAFFIGIQDNFSEKLNELKAYQSSEKYIQVSESNLNILNTHFSVNQTSAYFTEAITLESPVISGHSTQLIASPTKRYVHLIFSKIPSRGPPVLLS